MAGELARGGSRELLLCSAHGKRGWYGGQRGGGGGTRRGPGKPWLPHLPLSKMAGHPDGLAIPSHQGALACANHWLGLRRPHRPGIPIDDRKRCIICCLLRTATAHLPTPGGGVVCPGAEARPAAQLGPVGDAVTELAQDLACTAKQPAAAGGGSGGAVERCCAWVGGWVGLGA